MKINIVSHSDTVGGAARAAYRLHQALIKNGLISEMIVKVKQSDDFTVVASPSKLLQTFSRGVGFLSNNCNRLQKTKSPTLHSFNFIGSYVFRKIQSSNAEIINLHWINAETLTIKQISKINKPIILTLHDMWAFCGSEHLSVDTGFSQFRLGYDKKTKDSDHISGIDLNYFTWCRKKKYWNKPFTIVTPSTWLSKCVRESKLFSGWDVHTIPNTLNTDVFKPMERNVARKVLNLPQNKKLIGFGAMGGGADPNKGFDLLVDALLHLDNKTDYHCVVFGQSAPKDVPNFGLPVIYLGHLHDDATLALFYNAIDVMVVPSRQEAFGQAASEAQASATPVVAFRTTGLIDVVEHQTTGYLAKPFEASDLACGISWCLNDEFRYKSLSLAARERAKNLWSEKVVALQYRSLYEAVLK